MQSRSIDPLIPPPGSGAIAQSPPSLPNSQPPQDLRSQPDPWPQGIQDRTAQVKQQALALGFHQVGIATIDPDRPPLPAATSALQRWLDRGFGAQMDWMAAPKRFDARQFLPEARSVICVALNYYCPDQRPDSPEIGKIARYAWGRDYHRVLESRLKALAQWLSTLDPNAVSRWAVDSAPVQDKAWAQEAGLGWIAKNGNLITRAYGSWVFLGEVFTSLALLPDRPHTHHCGSCTRCLDACPTGAIPEPFVVDANRCIAYHTIENRADTLPADIADNLQGWIAGCDICQDVCPWNQRFARATDVEDFQARSHMVAPRLAELANLSDRDWDERFRGSALRRIKPAMWRRNARASLKLGSDALPTPPQAPPTCGDRPSSPREP